MRLKQLPQALIVVVALLCAPTDARLNAQEKQPRIQYKISGDGQIGLTAIDPLGNRKSLTFDEEGQTNSTVLKIDGKDVEFGMAEGGKWDVEQAPLGKGKDGKTRRGHKSVWTHEKITITQIVEIVPSRGGELDACVISYVMENKDNQPHKVGIRAMIDTQIGDNDGNPFAIPGKKETITTSADFKGKDVPELVAAFENDD